MALQHQRNLGAVPPYLTARFQCTFVRREEREDETPEQKSAASGRRTTCVQHICSREHLGLGQQLSYCCRGYRTSKASSRKRMTKDRDYVPTGS